MPKVQSLAEVRPLTEVRAVREPGKRMRSRLLDAAVELFKAKVCDVGPEVLTVELTGRPDKLDALITMLEPYGIREMVQSGMVAIGRGPRSMTQPSLRVAERSA